MRSHMHTPQTGVEGTSSPLMAVLPLPVTRHACYVTVSLEAEPRCSRQCLLKLVQVRLNTVLLVLRVNDRPVHPA